MNEPDALPDALKERNQAVVGSLLLAAPGEESRFAPRSKGFIRRARLVNGLLSGWPIVVGTGSWVEAHLVARLAMATRVPNLGGCGITPREVIELVHQVQREQGELPLVILIDSVAPDQGQALMRQLKQRQPAQQILLLVQDESWVTRQALAECKAQAVVSVYSFGTGVLIRALQALRHGQTYLDPNLRDLKDEVTTIPLSGRERQVLDGLARGLTNKQIAVETEIAATTVRDYVSRLCRKCNTNNRTQLVSQAISLGLIRGRT